MNSYHMADSIRITASFKNAAGVLTDPGGVTVKLKRPDASISSWTYVQGNLDSASVIKDSTGVYHIDFITVAAPGYYYYQFVGTFPAAAQGVGGFFVLEDYALG